MLAYLLPLLGRLRSNDRGVTAMEYGVIAAGIVVAVATAAKTIGTDLTSLFTSIGGSL
jgi:pilus assembly protein Flp/PilA